MARARVRAGCHRRPFRSLEPVCAHVEHHGRRRERECVLCAGDVCFEGSNGDLEAARPTQITKALAFLHRPFKPQYWYFEPRAKSHDIGGWYVETRANAAREQPPGSAATASADTRHALLVAMSAAYRTLDAEHRGERGRGRASTGTAPHAPE